MKVELLHGDCRAVLASMPEASVDAIVTDPPYGLEFMGKDWDRPWAVSASNGVGYAGRDDLTLPSHRDSRNANCRACGGRMRGAKRCACDKPQWDRHPREDMLAFQDWFTEVAAECLRVLKPGGHLLAFGGTRTYHRMACAIEDAGFEIRDSIHWVYGSGFPKSLDVSKAIDKAAGAEGEVVGERRFGKTSTGQASGWNANAVAATGRQEVRAAATLEARRWEGWGTALKPAHEPIVVARKPLAGTVAGNVLAFGTGGLNIDGCRVAIADDDKGGFRSSTYISKNDSRSSWEHRDNGDAYRKDQHPSGRWPANVVFDAAAGEALDAQSGQRPGAISNSNGRTTAFASKQPSETVSGYNDSGGASRFFTRADFGEDDWPFFYCAKPGRKERNAGLDGLPKGPRVHMGSGGRTLRDGVWVETHSEPQPRANHHPTVKPVALMRHLVRLVTPPGGTVLDPFAGSGTTLVAAVLEGFDAIGVEMTDEYLPIIEGRVAWAQEQVAAEPPRLL